MSAFLGRDGSSWPDDAFWDELERLERGHIRIQSQHDFLRGELKDAMRTGGVVLQETWKRYCDVIAELNRITLAIEALRTRVDRTRI